MNSNELPTIKVSVKLKEEQFIEEKRSWVSTFFGKERLTPNAYLEWVCTDLETAIKSLNSDEVEYFTITNK